MNKGQIDSAYSVGFLFPLSGTGTHCGVPRNVHFYRRAVRRYLCVATKRRFPLTEKTREEKEVGEGVRGRRSEGGRNGGGGEGVEREIAPYKTRTQVTGH